MKKANELNVKGTPVRVMRVGDEDFICLTDMAAGRGDSVRAADVIKNWLRARYTLEFLGAWESLHNPDFKVVEFDHFRIQAGLPNFVLSVSEWINSDLRDKGSADCSMENLRLIFDGGGNVKIRGKGMNVVRQSCEHFSSRWPHENYDNNLDFNRVGFGAVMR